ncbi:MAG: VCBS repeat-containing protein, partial [Planctomycetes bacterium]|nr:VCBS repeat-containing protein [Planctomycetota bacterium]
ANVTLTNNSSIDLTGTITVAGTLNASNAGTSIAFLGSVLQTSGAGVINVAGALTAGATSVLDLYDGATGGTLKFTATSGTPMPDTFGTVDFQGSTVEYESLFISDVTMQTRYNAAASTISYNNLIIDNAAAATIKAVTPAGTLLKVDGTLTVDDGTFTPAGNGDFNNVTIDSGQGELFEGGANTYTVSGNWSNAAVGNYSAGTSTVDFDGTGTVTLSTFNNVIISAGTRTIITSNTITVNGTLEMKGGATWALAGFDPVVTGLATATGNFTISSSVAGTLALNGGLTVSGGDLTLSAGAATTVTVSNTATTVNATRALTVGANITLTSNTTVNLSGTTTVTGVLNAGATTAIAFTGGTLATSGAGTINVTNASGVFTESGTSIIDLYDGATAGSLTFSATSGTPMPNTFDTVDLAGSTVTYNAVVIAADTVIQTQYAGGNISYYNLTLQNGGATGAQYVTTGAGTLVVANTLTIDNRAGVGVGEFAPATNGDFANVSILGGATFFAGSYSHTVSGNWANSGTFTAGTSTVEFDGAGGGTASVTLNGTSSFNNVRLNKSGGATLTVSAAMNVNGTAQFTAGRISHSTLAVTIVGLSTFDGSVTIQATTGAMTLSGGWAFTNGTLLTASTPTIVVAGTGSESGTSTLDLYDGTSGGTLRFTSASGTPMPATFDTIDFGTNSTIEYESTPTADVTVQTTYAGGTISYYNLTIDNGAGAAFKMITPASPLLKVDGTLLIDDGNFSLGGNADLNNVTIGGTGASEKLIIAGAGATVTVSGAWTNSIGAAGLDAGTSLVEFDGAGAVTASGAQTWYDVKINKSGGGTVTSTGVWTISRHLTLQAGTWDQGTANQAHTVAGDWTAAGGSFTADSGTITFNGTGTQTLTAASNFYNLSVTGTSNTVQTASNITAGGTLTVNNTFNLTASNSLSVTGAVTIGASGTLTFAGTNTVTFSSTVAQDGVLTFSGAATVTVGGNVTSTGGVTSFDGGGSMSVTGIYDMDAGAGARLNVNAATVTLSSYLRGRVAGQQVNITSGSLTCAYFSNAGSPWWSYFDLNVTGAGMFKTTGTTSQGSYGAVSITGAGSLVAQGSGTYYTRFFGTVTLGNSGAVIDVNGQLRIDAGGTLTAAGFAPKIYVAEDFLAGTPSGYGTFTPGNSEVIFDGTLAAVVYPTTFYDLTINKSAAVTVTQSSTGTPIVVQNTFTVQGSGTYTANSKAHDFNDVTITAGTFNATAVTHTVSGNWSMTGGTFTNTGSTIKFDGTGTIASTGAFDGFEVAAGAGTHTVSGAVTVSGVGTITSGTLAVNSSVTLTLNGAMTVNGGALTSAGTLAVNGGWTDNAGTVNCTGGDAVLGGSSGTAFTSKIGSVFYDLTLNKNALATTVTYSGDVAVSRNLTLTRGTFDMQNASTIGVSDATTLNVAATNGKLRAMGTSAANRITIEGDTATPADGFTFDVYGVLEARNFRVINPDANGLRVHPGATVIELNYATFDYPTSGGCLLNITGVAAGFPTTNQGSSFSDNGLPTGTISNVKADATTVSVEFTDFSGSLAHNVVVAENRDDDPMDRIRWRDASFPTISSLADNIPVRQNSPQIVDLSAFEFDVEDGGGQRFIAVGDDTGRVFVVEVLGGGSFGAAVQLTDTSSYVRGVGVADFDNDGDFDVVFAAGNGNAYRIKRKSISSPLVAGDFGSPAIIGAFTAATYGMDIGVEDFNNDGFMDFVVSANNAYYTLFKNNGNGTFQTTLLTSTGPANGRAKTAADFDRDGAADFVSLDSGTTNVYFWKGFGDGGFARSTQSAAVTATNGYGVAAGDYDGDFLPDLMVENSGTGLFSFLKGLGNGRFAAPASAGQTAPATGAIGFDAYDVNSDGKMDVVVSMGAGYDLLYYPGNGNGTLGAAVTIQLNFTTSASYTLAAPTHGNTRLNWSVDTDTVNPALMSISVSNSAADQITITPVASATGSDDVTFILSDSTGFVSLKTDVTVNVNAASAAAPVISSRLDNISVSYNQPLNVDLSQFGSDPDQVWGRDYFVTDNDSSNVYLVQINGDGTYGAPVNFGDQGNYIRGSAVADFDNDGDLDFIIARNADVQLYRRVSGGASIETTDFLGPTLLGPFTSSTWGMDLACEDFNGDGSMDIVFSGNNGYYYCFLNDGNGRFAALTLTTAGPSAGRGKAAGDFNGDGFLDFISADSGTTTLHVWQGDGAGNFARTDLATVLPTADAYGLTAGDFDGDGKDDAVANDTSGNLYFLKGTGNGTFEARVLIEPSPTTATAGGVALDRGDFNGDGNLDLVVCDDPDDDLLVLSGNGDGTFAAAVTVAANFTTGTERMVAAPTHGSRVLAWSVDPASVNTALLSATISDVNAGILSITPVTGQSGTDEITLILSDNNMGTVSKTDVTVTVSPFVGNPPVVEATADNFTTTDDTVLKVDLSRFGWDPDDANGRSFVVVGDDSTRLYAMAYNGDGSFGSPVSLGDVGNTIRGAGIADFDNDGDLDVVFGDGSGNAWFIQRVAHSSPLQAADFTTKVLAGTFSASSYGMDICVEDFNNDGKSDFIVGGNNGVYTMFRGNGNGTFTTSVIDPANPANGRAKDAADFDEDGFMDFVSLYSGAGNLYLWRGNGAYAFSRTNYAAAAPTADGYGIAAGDFNHDGHQDVVVQNNVTGLFYFLAGKGDGTFYAGVSTGQSVPAGAVNFDAVDMTGDGKLDLLVVANAVDTSFRVFPGNGDGTFSAATLIPATFSSTNLVAACPDYGSTTLTWSVDAPSVNTALFSASVTDATADTLTITPVASAFGQDDITLVLTDSNSGVTQKVDVTVQILSAAAAGDPVIQNSLDAIRVREDTVRQVDLSGYGYDPDSANGKPFICYADENGIFWVCESTGAGTWGTPISLGDLGGSLNGYGVADFDNDGDLDIVYARNNDTCYILRRIAVSVPMVAGDFAPTVNIGAFNDGGSPGHGMDVATEDFNHDGNMDFVVSGNNGDYRLFKGTGLGTFTMSTLDAAVPGSGRGKDAADFDNDGNPDFVALENTNAYIHLWKGDGQGNFQRLEIVGGVPVANSYGCAAADFDSDGDADLIVNNTTGGVYYVPGNGNLSFGSPVLLFTITGETNNIGMDAHDWDNDGLPDLLVSADVANDVIYYRNTTSGGTVSFAAGVNVHADFTATTNRGVACPNFGSKKLRWSIDAASVDTNVFTAEITSTVTQRLTITPVAGASGTDDITLVLNDANGGQTQKTNVTVTVSAVADGNPLIEGLFDNLTFRQNQIGFIDASAFGFDADAANGKPYFVVNDDDTNFYVVQINGDGTFGTPVNLGNWGGSDNVHGVAIADFDNDGDLDILFGDDDGKVMIVRRIANSIPLVASDFSAKAVAGTFTSASWGMDMACGDFNNDGNQDAVISGNNGVYALFIGRGDGFFDTTEITASGPANGRGKDAADFNGDGKIDFASICSGTRHLTLWFGDGAGGFTETTYNNFIPVADSYALAAGDFDGDGRADLVISNDTTGAFSFYKGAGAGTFASGVATGITHTGDSGVDAVDFNGDGKLDLIISQDSNNTAVFLYTGVGNGTFNNAGSIAVTFTNNNRNVATPDYGSKALTWSVDPATVNTALFNITTENGPAALFSVTPVAGQSGSDDVTFVLTDNNGGTVQKTDVTITYTAVAYANPLISAKLDNFTTPEDTGFTFDLSRFGSDPDGGNGKHYVVATDDTGNVRTIPLNLDGTYGAAIVLGDLGDLIEGIGIADFDNDGTLDYVFADGVATYGEQVEGGGQISELFFAKRVGTSNTMSSDWAIPVPVGEFTASGPSSYDIFLGWTTPTNYGMDICVEDFNNDGKMDLIVGGDWTVIDLFIGNGDGTFEKTTVTSSLTGNTRAKDAADFDRDGNMDFAMTLSNDNEIYVHMGDGAGGFTTSTLTNYAYNSGSYALAAGDFDGDHLPDLVTGNSGNGRYYFIKGNGDGTFQTGVECGTQDAAFTKIAGNATLDAIDVNNDGLLDLIIHYDSGHTVRVYTGNGNGTFAFTNGAPILTTMSGTDLGFAAPDFGSTALAWTLDPASVDTNLLDVSIVNAASGIVTVTPKTNAFGNDDITFTLTDNNGGVTSKTNVTITVQSVNDPPVFGGLPDVGIATNSAGLQDVIALPAYASDVESFPSLVYTIDSQSNAAICNVTIDGSNFVDLGATGATGGTNTVVIRCSDGAPSDDKTDTFVVTVAGDLSWVGKWNYRKNLTFTAAAGAYYADLTISDAGTLAHMRADRADVRILTAGQETAYNLITTNPLRVRWNLTIPAAGYTADTYIYYGNPAAAAPSYSFTPNATSLTPRVMLEDSTFIRRWSDAINWSPILAPTAFTNVTVNTGYTNAPLIDATAAARAVTVGVGATLDFGEGNITLTAGDDVAVNGTLTLREGSRLALVSNSTTNATTKGVIVSATGSLSANGAAFVSGSAGALTSETLISDPGAFTGKNYIGKWIHMTSGLARGRYYSILLNNNNSLTRADTSSATDTAGTLDPALKRISCGGEMIASDGEHVGRYVKDLTGSTGYHRIVRTVNASPDLIYLTGDLTNFTVGDDYEITDGVQAGDGYEVMQFAEVTSAALDGVSNGYLLLQDGAEATLQRADLHALGANFTDKQGFTAKGITAMGGAGEGLSMNTVRVRDGYVGLRLETTTDLMAENFEVTGCASHGVQMASGSSRALFSTVRLASNGGDGLRAEAAGGTGAVLYDVTAASNGGAGLRFLSGTGSVAIIKCAAYSNGGEGIVASSLDSFRVSSSLVFGQRAGTGRGVDLAAATDVVLTDDTIEANLVGVRAANDVTGLTIWGGSLGFNQPNDTWQAQMGAGGSGAVVQMRGASVAETNVFDPAGIDQAGDLVMSRGHKTPTGAAKGATYIWGDYSIAGASTEKFNRADASYASAASTPRVLRGNSSVGAVSTSDANATTSAWVVTYDSGVGKWTVFNSLTGDQTNVATSGVPYTSDGGEVTFTVTESSPLPSDLIDFVTLAASGDANTKKSVFFGPTDAGYNGGLSRLTVPATSTLQMLGSAAGPTAVSGMDANTRYLFRVQGTVNADQYAFTQPAVSGVEIDGAATVTALSNGAFDLPAASGSLLNFSTYTGAELVISGCAFENSAGAAGASNVKATSATTDAVRFSSFSGSFAGEDNDDDPAERVLWGSVNLPDKVYAADPRLGARAEVAGGFNVGTVVYGDLLNDRIAGLAFTARYKAIDAVVAKKMRVQVGTAAGLADLWDSGMVRVPDLSNNDQGYDLLYRGASLAYGVTYYYRVRFEQATGIPSPWVSSQFTVQRPVSRTTAAGTFRNAPGGLMIRGRAVGAQAFLAPTGATSASVDVWVKKKAGYSGEATLTLFDPAGNQAASISTDAGSNDAWKKYTIAGAISQSGGCRLEFFLPDPASEVYVDDVVATFSP